MAIWINLVEARLLLADHLNKAGEPEYLEAFSTAHGRMIRALRIDGADSLPSRSNGAFDLTFRSMRESRDWALEDGNKIPSLFWWHYHEAEKEQLRTRHIVISSTDSYAGGTDECFEFRLSIGLIDNGIMHGRACQVEVLRDRIPGLPRQQGRPPKPYYDDSEAIGFAAARLNAGDWYYDIAPIVTGMMKGLSEEAKRKRLVTALKERGYKIPKRHERP
jgi:hypothetical protein